MIFVTVGTQLPFDRLIKAVDLWAELRGRKDLFAQIGHGGYRPHNIRWEEFIDVPEFEHYVREAQAIVAHAGMGTIITALDLGKPILVMPRRADLKETRNDHQVATAKYLKQKCGILVAFDESELITRLDELILHKSGDYKPVVSHQLIEIVRSFIKANEPVRTFLP